MTTERTLLVDGNNILIRAVKATERVPLSAHGVPTAALMVFVNSLSRHIREEQPDRLMVCWDGGKSSYRRSVFAEYKAKRHDKPTEEQEVETPFGLAKQFLSFANIHHVEMPGVEADDIIASYWQNKPYDEKLVILSGDKDFFQLLNGWTEQVRPGQGDTDRWTVNRVRSHMQCRPEQIPMVMALTGDTVDGIPGVPGFGTKTAVKWLGRCDWDLKRVVLECPKAEGMWDVIERNLKLVDLRSPMPGVSAPRPPLFTPTDPNGMMYPGLIEFLDAYELRSIRERLLSNTLWRD